MPAGVGVCNQISKFPAHTDAKHTTLEADGNHTPWAEELIPKSKGMHKKLSVQIPGFISICNAAEVQNRRHYGSSLNVTKEGLDYVH